jgi:hypothetical protein
MSMRPRQGGLRCLSKQKGVTGRWPDGLSYMCLGEGQVPGCLSVFG